MGKTRSGLLAAAALLGLCLVGTTGGLAQETTTYTYDALGRLQKVTVGTKSTTYNYDLLGNRTSVVTQGVNSPPVANPDTKFAVKNWQQPEIILVRANDTDADNHALSVISVGTPSNGGGTAGYTSEHVTFTPATDFEGQTSFSYTISDGHGQTASSTVTVTVGPNTPPTAVNDVAWAAKNQWLPYLTPAANDTDPNGHTLSVVSVETPSHGQAAISGSYVVYAPDTDFVGSDSFTYTVSDGHGGTADGVVAIAMYDLLTSTSYSASSNLWNAYSGLSTYGRMWDGDFDDVDTAHLTDLQYNSWIEANWGGQSKAVLYASFHTMQFTDAEVLLNGAQVQYKNSSGSWVTVHTISGATQSNYVNVWLGVGTTAVRLYRPEGIIGVGDFMVYGY